MISATCRGTVNFILFSRRCAWQCNIWKEALLLPRALYNIIFANNVWHAYLYTYRHIKGGQPYALRLLFITYILERESGRHH